MTPEQLQTLPVIEFSYNWNNKLKAKAFTTLRLHNTHKYFIGANFLIKHKNEIISRAECKAVIQLTLSTMNDYTAYLDTGYPLSETIGIIEKMYPKINLETQLFDLILLENQSQIRYSLDPYGNGCNYIPEELPFKFGG